MTKPMTFPIVFEETTYQQQLEALGPLDKLPLVTLCEVWVGLKNLNCKIRGRAGEWPSYEISGTWASLRLSRDSYAHSYQRSAVVSEVSYVARAVESNRRGRTTKAIDTAAIEIARIDRLHLGLAIGIERCYLRSLEEAFPEFSALAKNIRTLDQGSAL